MTAELSGRVGPIGRFAAGRIRQLRELRRLSRGQLSQLLQEAGYEVSPESLGFKERLHTRFSIDDTFHIARVLNVPAASLIDPDVDPCTTCLDAPPAGFACQTCGATS